MIRPQVLGGTRARSCNRVNRARAKCINFVDHRETAAACDLRATQIGTWRRRKPLAFRLGTIGPRPRCQLSTDCQRLTMKTLALACVVTLCASTAAFAQSLTNFGPNAPARGDSFGQVPTGTYPPLQKRGYRSYAYSPYWHHRHHHYRYHRHRNLY